MYDNHNYPVGADTTDAPWNKDSCGVLETEGIVTFNVTIDATIRSNEYDCNGKYEGKNPVSDMVYSPYQMMEDLKSYINSELAVTTSNARQAELKEKLKELEFVEFDFCDADVNKFKF